MLLRPALVAALLPAVIVLVAGCASGPRGGDAVAGAAGGPKYPPRRPGCKLAIYPSAPPELVDTWDDLGVAEIGCHIDTPKAQCLQQLQAEACRMGANIMYNMPVNPLRPKEQALVFRGKVAHTRAAPPAPAPKVKEVDTQAPPPASAAEVAGPVMPLTGPGAANICLYPPDGGDTPDGGSAHD